MASDLPSRPRLLPDRQFPSYAYLPGKRPHPVRDPAGHSYANDHGPSVEAAQNPDLFLWGIDLFNHGYYWEAHEAWETLWRSAESGAPRRLFFKGLILLSAAGLKIREGKHAAAARHAKRAAALLRGLADGPDLLFETALGMPLAALAQNAEAASARAPGSPAPTPGLPWPVFSFVLGTGTRRAAFLTPT